MDDAEIDGDAKPRMKYKKPKKVRKEKKKPKKHRRSKEKKNEQHNDGELTGEQWPPVDGQCSHKDAVDCVKSNIDWLLARDPLMADLAQAITLEEVDSLVALEKGQAMTVLVQRQDASALHVIVHQNANVGHLKKAVEKVCDLNIYRKTQDRPKKINWKYIWKSYWLLYEGQKLKPDHRPLRDWGIGNEHSVSFIRRLKLKWYWIHDVKECFVVSLLHRSHRRNMPVPEGMEEIDK